MSLDLRLPADVQQRLRDVSKRLGLPPSDLAARALRSYLRNAPDETLREKARRQSVRARRADYEDDRDEITAWEESADTSGWKA